MNELELIHRQLDTERSHFTGVARACAEAMKTSDTTVRAEFVEACAEYFAFALTRLKPGQQTLRKLQSARDASAPAFVESWTQFLQSFEDEISTQFGALGELRRSSLPVTEWRVISRIDADSILAERSRYQRVEETLPEGISLSHSEPRSADDVRSQGNSAPDGSLPPSR